MMYDVTNKDSFNSLKNSWLKDLSAIAPENVLKIVVGNKTDLLEDVDANIHDKSDLVTDKMARDFATSKRAEAMKVSAKKNVGIDEVFQRIGERLIQ